MLPIKFYIIINYDHRMLNFAIISAHDWAQIGKSSEIGQRIAHCCAAMRFFAYQPPFFDCANTFLS